MKENDAAFTIDGERRGIKKKQEEEEEDGEGGGRYFVFAFGLYMQPYDKKSTHAAFSNYSWGLAWILGLVSSARIRDHCRASHPCIPPPLWHLTPL